MPFPPPEPGLVIGYAYLWHSEYEQGQEEGLKDRPCAIVLSVRDEEGDIVVSVVPVTHTPPTHPGEGIEIPVATKQRLGLDNDRSWIVVNEVNRFVWPGPDLRPIAGGAADRFDYGFLPPSLFRKIKECLLASASPQVVARTQ